MIPGGVNELLLRSAAAGGATAGRSVRFNAPDSAYLSRTPASAGNRRTWTWSGWLKRSAFNDQDVFSAQSSTAYFTFRLQSNNTLRVNHWTSGVGDQILYISSQVFRDPSSWYHFVIAVDTTQATSTDRIKAYVNNTQITTWSTSTAPSQNLDTVFNTANTHFIGGTGSGTFAGQYLNGYLALVHMVDGQALTPSSFGETSATTGQWIAKTYSGSYGTNGFFLDFSDNSGATSTTLGKDKAGSNNWTPNNLSVTAGSGNDSLRDHPTSAGTSTGLGGEVSGNYCTLNPLANPSGATLSNGNLDWSSTAAQNGACAGTIYVSSGKWYWEVTDNSGANALYIGITKSDDNLAASPGTTPGGYYYIDISNAYTYNNNNLVSYGSTWASGDVIGVALNMDAGTLVFYKNGVSQGTAFTGLSGAFAPSFGDGGSSTAAAATLNAGQRAFAYTAPSGFSPLVDTLLPTPTIAKPNTVMDVVTYTGSGASKTITLPGAFNPDLVWIKARSIGYAHALFDVIRGGRKILISNSTAAEDDLTAYSSGITSFNSDGFTLDSDGAGYTNESTRTYVGWCFDAGSSNATNTSGTITSTVRANISAGFSIVTASPSGTADTYGHGLGVTPALIISKRRDSTSAWYVRTSFLPNPGSHYLMLNRTDAVATDTSAWANTAANSSVITVNASYLYGGSANLVHYCFAPVAGYSAFGSYTGNGSTNGPFVYTGFRPAYVLIKGSSSITSWNIVDKQRLGYNADNYRLFAESSSAENATGILDFTANGFKIRNTGGDYNDNAQTYIYACFAESPLAYARAR